MFVLSGRQVPVLFICFNALTLMFLLKNLFFPDVRTKGGPGFGDAPGDPPPMTPALAGTHADGVRDRAFCVSRHWTFPFAGGELAHRGTCPTLVLYLFKEINPPNQSILIL